MNKLLHCRIMIVVCWLAGICPGAIAGTVTTHWGGPSAIAYDTGFMHKLMRSPEGAVSLFNMDLIENDAPGSGRSEKGPSTTGIWGDRLARKGFVLDDPRAQKAWLVVYAAKMGTQPLSFSVNGNPTAQLPPKPASSRESYRWVEFPAAWLKAGTNIVELGCPQATKEEEGWVLEMARADEFEAGGGDPAGVGKNSWMSFDAGKSWQESPFGPAGQTRAEYSIRLSLDRYVRTGWLATPVIDLWRGSDTRDFVVAQREIQKMSITARATVPANTTIEYYLRRGVGADPFSSEWGPYEPIGAGAALDFEIAGLALNRRYIQLRAVFSTSNPLESPVLKSARIEASLVERVPRHENIVVLEATNPVIEYSSVPWEWEKWDRPEFKQLREQENLDEVVAGSRTQFDAQVKLLDYVTRRWSHNDPTPEYPAWDAASIISRIGNAGGGGYCLQYNNTLGGLCMAYGWQARLVNAVGHEVIEVWNDEFGKWVFFDADFESNYNYDPRTGEPLSMLELHRFYLKYYYPDRPIDWMNDTIAWEKAIAGKEVPVKRGALTWPDVTMMERGGTPSGFCNAAHLRIVPRNNWYEKPHPRPLNQGLVVQWPWDGYINWYDPQTPPKRQYSWYTDRPRDMWPTLNLVHVDATQGFGNDRLFLRFETYTPNFSHYEINVDDTGWKKVGERWTWLFQSGRNDLKVRSVNRLGAKGKPSAFVINYADAHFTGYEPVP